MSGERQKIFPVLLSGGSGSRLWPLSRENAPKQLLRLIGEGTLLEQTALRAIDDDLFEPLTVIGNNEHRFTIAEQVKGIAPDSTIVLEPMPRNTAPAAAVAALIIAESSPDGLMLLMPADHLVGDVDGFRATVREAVAAAQAGHLTLFGIKPDSAATGYGYIRAGEPIAGKGPARHVAEFREKPDAETAEAYLASGDYLWNSGIFLMPVEQLLAELQEREPELLQAACEALTRATRDTDFVRLEAEAFGRCRSVSIDHAVMEHTTKAAVLPADFPWTDVGSWTALWSMAERDAQETATVGEVLTWATRDSYIRSEGPLVATLGVEDLIVVATKDAVLVARKDHDQDIRKIVEHLRQEKPGHI